MGSARSKAAGSAQDAAAASMAEAQPIISVLGFIASARATVIRVLDVDDLQRVAKMRGLPILSCMQTFADGHGMIFRVVDQLVVWEVSEPRMLTEGEQPPFDTGENG